MTVRGGGVPIASLGFHSGKKNGSAASERSTSVSLESDWNGPEIVARHSPADQRR
jgi:hypothetical protein